VKEIGIVVCNFNKKEYLEQCLNSVLASDLPRESYDIVVVDNASEDGAPQMVKEKFSDEVILLQNSVNTGGSGGFARGMEYCNDHGYDYVALLDNDIRLEKNTLSELKKYIEHHPEVGVAGSKICTMDNPEVLQELGSFIDHEKFNAITPLKGYKDSEELPSVVKCDYVPACCLITTKEVLKKAKSFDVNHFIYWDDMDWCTRVKEAGYEIHALNASRVYHKMGAINSVNTFSMYYFERNRILFFLKHLAEDELPAFIDKISEEIVNMTFFSNEKGKVNSAISLLLGLEDLFINELGRRDDHILEKEQTNPLVFLEDKKHLDIVLIASENIAHIRRVYEALELFFERSITLATRKEQIDQFSHEFEGAMVIEKNSIIQSEQQLVFYHVEHMMEHHRLETSFEEVYFIDAYLNVKKSSELEYFMYSYENYKSIFMNIYRPVLDHKFQQIRKRLKESNV
jgi:GT2 family glycosyltransferase